MCTACMLTVSPSMLCSGGGVCYWGSAPGGGGSIPACTEADPPCEQNHTRLWKHNLAPTSLRAVTSLKQLSESVQTCQMTVCQVGCCSKTPWAAMVENRVCPELLRTAGRGSTHMSPTNKCTTRNLRIVIHTVSKIQRCNESLWIFNGKVAIMLIILSIIMHLRLTLICTYHVQTGNKSVLITQIQKQQPKKKNQKHVDFLDEVLERNTDQIEQNVLEKEFWDHRSTYIF